jgi:PAS domain S-box-containing protein
MKKILVVDNDEPILQFMNDLLGKDGHEVVTAQDGLSALDILKTYTPDVIFTDLVMPNIGGKKLCEIIRGTEELKKTFLIVLSAVASEEEADIAELGADACIAKAPFNEMAHDILAALDQIDLVISQRLSRDLVGIRSTSLRGITKELLSVKRHFEIILESMSEGILEITGDGRIVYANPSAISLVNMPEKKLLASNFVEIFSKDDRRRIGELLNSINHKPQAITDESPVNLKGHQVTLEILPLGEDMSSTILILNDVTERKRSERELRKAHDELEERVKERTLELAKVNDNLKRKIEELEQAEKALRQSEEKYRQHFENVFDVMFSIDRNYRVVNVSPSVEKLLGYRPEELIGRSFQDLNVLVPTYLEAALSDMKRVLKGERIALSLYEFIAKDGTRKYGEVSGAPLILSGKVIGVISVARDVTGRKQAEKELFQEKENYRVLVEESPFGISLIGEEGQYKYTNPKFTEIFGFTLEDIPTGREWFRKAYPDKKYRNRVISTWLIDQEETKSGEGQPRSFSVTCKDGLEKMILFRSVKMQTGEHIVIYDDITE